MNGALEELAARVSPAVVQIQTTGYGPLTEGDSDRGRTALIVRQHAVGSGVIVDANGYIMTNAHVVEGAHRIRVALPMSLNSSPANLPAGRRQLFDAKVLGIHKESDLALLKIDQTNLPTLSLEAPQNIRVGQMVLAVGSPEGLQSSITMGVISAVARQADPTKSLNYVQTDAPINPGNSGGPLVDMDGYVVGINTFILSQSGGSEGLGFAIPARVVNFVYHSLRKYGHVHHVEIGAGAQEITPTLAEGLGLPQSWGVIVDDVVPDGPAASAGVQVQDIILTADDRPIETMSALTAATYLHNPDQPVKLEILRGTDAQIKRRRFSTSPRLKSTTRWTCSWMRPIPRKAWCPGWAFWPWISPIRFVLRSARSAFRVESSWWAAPLTLLCRTAACRLGTLFTRLIPSRLIRWKRCAERFASSSLGMRWFCRLSGMAGCSICRLRWSRGW